MRISIGAKQLIYFILMIAIIAVCGWSGVKGASAIQHELETTYSIGLMGMELLIESDRDLQQLLVAERTMLSAEPASEVFISAKADYDENIAQSLERWNEYTALAETEEEKALFGSYESARADWEKLSADVVKGAASVDPAVRQQAQSLSLNEAAVRFETMRDVIDQLTGIGLENAEKSQNNAQHSFKLTKRLLQILMVIGIVLGLFLAGVNALTIGRPIKRLASAAQALGQGDYSFNLRPVKAFDELGLMTNAFIEMKVKMETTTKELMQRLVESSTSVAASSQQLSAGADESGKAIQQVAQTVQEVAKGSQVTIANISKAQANLDHTAQAIISVNRDIEEMAAYATQAAAQGEEGRKAADNAVRIINRAAQSVQDTTKVVHSLGAKTQQIGEFIGIITGIADQTNLLALNAAVEAARAGDAGRGFAVVAEEVRKLAEESNQAAGNITSLVKSIESEMATALNAMEQSDKEVVEGANTVGQTSEMLAEIVKGVQTINEKVQNISAAAEEINAQTGEVVDVMHSVASVAEENAAASEEVSSATEEQTASMEEIGASANTLAHLAQELQAIVTKFSVD